MSSVYILEPPTSGKVLLKTTVGDIDVELWAKETPTTCRNFIQLCIEGYYDNTIFHRVVKGFIAQGGDPNGDGTGGESIYGEPFKDEFHQRLRFARRGLLAMANGGKNDNASQFFFTLGPTPELQDKHTIFGKITGDTVFNMLKLEEGLIRDERPVYPHKILYTEVLNNPFSDMVPRMKEVEEVKEKKKKEKKPGVKNFKLLSFGAEAEEDEEESARINEKFSGKGKSTHDVLDDPKLSSKTEDVPTTAYKEGEKDEEEPEIDPKVQLENIRRKLKRNMPMSKPAEAVQEEEKEEEEDPPADEETPADPAVQLENIRKKLKRNQKKAALDAKSEEPMDAYEAFLEEQRQEKKRQKFEEIKQEIDSVKKDYHKNKLKKDKEKAEEVAKETEKDETVREYQNEYDRYKAKKDALPKKGAGREQFTLQLLEKFKKKLQNVKGKTGEEAEDEEEKEKEEKEGVEEKAKDEEDAWLTHRLSFQEKTPILAKDANKKDDDWFEIYDPRSTLNKRRRGEDATKFKK